MAPGAMPGTGVKRKKFGYVSPSRILVRHAWLTREMGLTYDLDRKAYMLWENAVTTAEFVSKHRDEDRFREAVCVAIGAFRYTESENITP